MPNTKSKLMSTPSLKSINYPHSNIKSTSMPRHENPVIFDPDARNKSFSTATQEPDQCRSTALKWSHFRQRTQQLNLFHPTLESSKFRSYTLKSSQFGPPTKIQVNFYADTKSKWFSPRVQKPRQFRPPTQQPNQLHPYTESKLNLISTLK